MHQQTELFNLDLYQKVEIDYEPIHDPAWDLSSNAQSTCESVGEQVKEDTKKTAHQHERESTHWIEKYWVERGSTKYWYWRYTWMNGRKLRRKYLGSVNSARARFKKVMVEEAILDGLSPCEIIEIIDSLN
ncbi:MAG: DUF4102 domain-containing protein [Rivularia sp. (in: cyanobacteria)]